MIWVAQALEVDIAAHGLDVAQAKRAFERTFSGYVVMADKVGQVPLSSLKPAPRIFWDAWKKVAADTVSGERMPSVDTYMLPVVTDEPISSVQ
jgi:hypothetical protein